MPNRYYNNSFAPSGQCTILNQKIYNMTGLTGFRGRYADSDYNDTYLRDMYSHYRETMNLDDGFNYIDGTLRKNLDFQDLSFKPILFPPLDIGPDTGFKFKGNDVSRFYVNRGGTIKNSTPFYKVNNVNAGFSDEKVWYTIVSNENPNKSAYATNTPYHDYTRVYGYTVQSTTTHDSCHDYWNKWWNSCTWYDGTNIANEYTNQASHSDFTNTQYAGTTVLKPEGYVGTQVNVKYITRTDFFNRYIAIPNIAY